MNSELVSIEHTIIQEDPPEMTLKEALETLVTLSKVSDEELQGFTTAENLQKFHLLTQALLIVLPKIFIQKQALPRESKNHTDNHYYVTTFTKNEITHKFTLGFSPSSNSPQTQSPISLWIDSYKGDKNSFYAVFTRGFGGLLTKINNKIVGYRQGETDIAYKSNESSLSDNIQLNTIASNLGLLIGDTDFQFVAFAGRTAAQLSLGFYLDTFQTVLDSPTPTPQ